MDSINRYNENLLGRMFTIYTVRLFTLNLFRDKDLETRASISKASQLIGLNMNSTLWISRLESKKFNE